MSKRLLWLAPLVMLAAGIWWIIRMNSAPPEVFFTVAGKSTLVDTVITNGKAEPSQFSIVRAPRPGLVTRLSVVNGQSIAAGAVIAELDTADIRSSLDAAQARVLQIQAELDAVQNGGRPAELAEIDGRLARIAVERSQLESELAAVRRLIEKQAATPHEATQLENRVAQFDLEKKNLNARRGLLFTPPDRAVLAARMQEASAAAASARRQIEMSLLRAPAAGIVYQVEVRPGAYLQPGDPVAAVGQLDSLNVKVYIDEPELGRVAPDLPVAITWDALPGRKWEGVVEKMPSQIAPLGSRQVGEVLVRIANQDHLLPPGANINAAIRSRSVSNALVIPKECLRRQDGRTGVYVVENAHLVWRDVETGVTNVTHAQITAGLKGGEQVLLATDISLHSGMEVRALSESARR